MAGSELSRAGPRLLCTACGPCRELRPPSDGQLVPFDGASGMLDAHFDKAIVEVIIARPLASPQKGKPGSWAAKAVCIIRGKFGRNAQGADLDQWSFRYVSNRLIYVP